MFYIADSNLLVLYMHSTVLENRYINCVELTTQHLWLARVVDIASSVWRGLQTRWNKRKEEELNALWDII